MDDLRLAGNLDQSLIGQNVQYDCEHSSSSVFQLTPAAPMPNALHMCGDVDVTDTRLENGEKKRSENDGFLELETASLKAAGSTKMRRVDWRWATAKGYFNKETNEWNEEMGGMAAYLAQRNERIKRRKFKCERAQAVRARKKVLNANRQLQAGVSAPNHSQFLANQFNGVDQAGDGNPAFTIFQQGNVRQPIPTQIIPLFPHPSQLTEQQSHSCDDPTYLGHCTSGNMCQYVFPPFVSYPFVGAGCSGNGQRLSQEHVCGTVGDQSQWQLQF